jgi:aminoglycoside 6'-N-acetyltransferase I
MGRRRNTSFRTRTVQTKRTNRSNLVYSPRAGRKPHGPKEIWFTPNLRGWPGWRTRQGRTGYDWIDTQAEAAYVQGMLIRQFFTFTYRTRSVLSLFFISIFSVSGILSCLLFLPTFMVLMQQPDIANIYFVAFLVVPVLLGSVIGTFGLLNVFANLGMLMQPTFTINTLSPDNPQAIEQAATILTTAFSEHWPDAWPTHEEAIEEVHGMLTEDRICIAAFDTSGDVIGWIGGISEYDGNVWELHPLAVKPDMQQQGVGRALVQAFEREVNQRGGLTVRLGSDDETGMTTLSNVNLYEDLWDKVRDIQNLKGHPYEFYQKLGYTIIGVMPDANGRGKPDIIMGKRIG